MIVIDANILIYSLIESEQTFRVHQLRERDADWRTAPLCLHEVLNVLTTFQRNKRLTLTQCQQLLGHAQRFMEQAQVQIDLNHAISLAAQYKLTGYDAQYVALAQMLDLPLITEDRKLRQAVPQIACSLQTYLDRFK